LIFNTFVVVCYIKICCYICHTFNILVKMTNRNEYGSIRVKLSTIEFLKEFKEAFDASYGKKFTMDEFINQMAASVEDGDPGVWDIYCMKQTQKKALQAKIDESQKLRELKKQ